jgi:ribosomal protein S18 acetylase RimI-like enzyme
MSDDLRRAIAFEEALRDSAVDRAEPFRFGEALFTDSLPRVWDANLLRVERANGASAAELAAEADRVQGGAGLQHRKLAVLDAREGERLAPGFQELGWNATRFLFMAHRGKPTRVPAASAVEVEADVPRPLRERIARDEPWARGEEDVRQVLESAKRIAAAGSARYFAVLEEGAVASCADLYSDGQTAQIEDVATLPAFRGRGYASAVVLAALAAARRDRHDFVFLVADEGDWPKELYARLGFEPLGRTFEFLRKPS